MIRKNKWLLIVTSLVTLLPMLVGLLLWNRLPETMATHWNLDGQADGYGSLPFAVFGLPLIMLAGHWLGIFLTMMDPKNKDRNEKPLTMTLWTIPFISNLCAAIQYSLALGVDISPVTLMLAGLGVMFLVVGNYLPKCRQNNTLGIRVVWTLASEENWNATHRFGGRVWVIGGAVLVLAAFLPRAVGIAVMIVALAALVVVPVAYSYLYYRAQKKRGEAPGELPKTEARGEECMLVITVVALILSFVTLFTGNIHVTFGEESFTIEASYYDDLTVDYDSITSVEYREGNVPGVRVFGFGSFRLLMGTFENDEFGRYTRYTYYAPDSCVVVHCNKWTLVLSEHSAEETQKLYESLTEKAEYEKGK